MSSVATLKRFVSPSVLVSAGRIGSRISTLPLHRPLFTVSTRLALSPSRPTTLSTLNNSIFQCSPTTNLLSPVLSTPFFASFSTDPSAPKSETPSTPSPVPTASPIGSTASPSTSASATDPAKKGDIYWKPKAPTPANADANAPKDPFLVRVAKWLKNFLLATLDLIRNPQKIRPKLSNMNKSIKAELKHYWEGSKLLAADFSTSARLIQRVMHGHVLTRRERKQLTRTAADMFRLIPFLVIVIVPFAELSLPFILKFAPNLLPTAFQDKLKKEEKLKRELKARLELAEFLQDTVEEMANSSKKEGAKQLQELIKKVRQGVRVSTESILAVARLFEDDLTMDSMSRPQLVNMCKYLGISPFGTDVQLRNVLRKKLASIKEDDQLIESEGIDTLTHNELKSACRERGMRAHGLTTAGYKRNLQQWLELSLHHQVPASLLILSRAFSIQEKRETPEESLASALSSMEEDVVDEVLLARAGVADTSLKLEILQRQNELIKEEEEQTAELNKSKDGISEEALHDITEDLAELTETSAVSDEKEALEQLKAERKQQAESPVMAAKPVTSLQTETVDMTAEERAAEQELAEDAKEEAINVEKAKQHLNKRIEGMIGDLQKRVLDVEGAIGDRFKLLDLDKDGYISEAELADAVKNFFKIAKTDEEAKAVASKVVAQLRELSSDGKISVQDFRKLVKKLKAEYEATH